MAGRMRQEFTTLLRRTKTTTILVTHDHDEAFAMADRIAVLNQGARAMDAPEVIYHLPATPLWPTLSVKPTSSPDSFAKAWSIPNWESSPIR